MSDDRAALEELADRLSDERRIVTFLLYKLTVSRLLLAAGERRFAAEALREVDQAVELLREGETRRDETARELAELWQISPDEACLPVLAARAPPPFDHTFTDHLTAFRGLAAEIESVSRGNRVLARAKLGAPGMRELQIQELSYRAALHALSQTLPPSLVSFLR